MRQELWALHLFPMLGTLLGVRARESRASEEFRTPPRALGLPLPRAGSRCWGWLPQRKNILLNRFRFGGMRSSFYTVARGVIFA